MGLAVDLDGVEFLIGEACAQAELAAEPDCGTCYHIAAVAGGGGHFGIGCSSLYLAGAVGGHQAGFERRIRRAPQLQCAACPRDCSAGRITLVTDEGESFAAGGLLRDGRSREGSRDCQ